MANEIKLHAISDLLEMDFFIPSYQRGYRWTEQQVTDLLSDIYAFAVKDNKTDGEFYCLQPIVVKEHSWLNKEGEAKTGWEVVDGQQRLTTLKILFSYLEKEHLGNKSLKSQYGKNPFTLDYEIRTQTETFINNISDNNKDNIDFYHISKAYQYISEWFDKKEKQHGVRSSILNTLVYGYKEKENPNKGVVQVIWYQIEESISVINSFIRINLGKISLTNSELIKALFLQERLYGKNINNNDEITKIRQLEIASEWDRIENMLQDDDFWWFINKGEKKLAARIEFIFDIMCSLAVGKDPEKLYRKGLTNDEILDRKNLSPTIEEKIGKDRYATFRYFYQKFDKVDEFEILKNEWDEVKEYFLTFEEWFNDPVWYHYIGFLISCDEKVTDIFDYVKFDSKSKNKIETKDQITASLKKRISKRFELIKWEYDNEGSPFLDLSYSSKNKQTIRELLLLFNIEHIVQQSKHKTLLYKFPFKAFKEIINENGDNTSWDVEHIDSFTTNPLNSRGAKIDWLQAALEDVEIDPNLQKRVDEFINNLNSKEDFDSIQTEIIAIEGEISENDDATKNNIGNLTLLDAGTNRGYGNALFPTKRRKIIEKDKKGVFIPICTKNVFLKYFDEKGSLRNKWGIDDIIKYRDVLTTTVIEFLPSKPINKSSDE